MIPTTNEIDHITSDERNKLVGYCEKDLRWFKFTRGVHIELCPICKSRFSHRVGFQLTTQRTFNESKLKKGHK